uniref:Uncharacterized protein n=1 Tax=Romanomermis culicivorax TaxID=13658 RepID=A0A915IWM7_ROMCU
MQNSIKLRPNQLVAVTKHTLESVAVPKPDSDIRISIATSDRDLTNHKPAALDKCLLHHTDKQKLEFALNKMTEKMCITIIQKAKALICKKPNLLAALMALFIDQLPHLEKGGNGAV